MPQEQTRASSSVARVKRRGSRASATATPATPVLGAAVAIAQARRRFRRWQACDRRRLVVLVLTRVGLGNRLVLRPVLGGFLPPPPPLLCVQFDSGAITYEEEE